MLYRFLIFLAFVTHPLNGLSSSFDAIEFETVTHISSFLDPKEIANFAQTKRRFRPLTTNSDFGIFLRNQSRFMVTTADGSIYFLEEYLYQAENIMISEIKDSNCLLTKKPKDFFKLLIKSLPLKPNPQIFRAEPFYNDTAQIDKLIDSLPNYQTRQEKLASTILELVIWAQIKTKVRAQVWEQFEDEIEEHVDENLDEQLDTQINNQLGSQIWDQLGGQIGPHVWEQLEDHSLDELTKILDQFQFSFAKQGDNFSEALIPAINSAFKVYQLCTFAMRHSPEFRDIHADFAEFILLRMTAEQIDEALSKLLIPDNPKGSYLIEAQLKMIRKHLLKLKAEIPIY